MKPEEHILNLINAVSDTARIQNGRDRQVISLLQYAEPMVFILHEGTSALYRSLDHLLIANAKAPFILGINLLQDKNPDVYLQARGVIRYEIVPRTEFMSMLNHQALWESVAYAHMYNSLRFRENHFTTVGVSTYELVRNNLLALMEESDELRMVTNACDYIQERTMLSRSGIMKMLSDLKKGKYIDIQRGVLISINQLPQNY